ncbi:LD-carboxypeptidase [Halobacillus shinanisalinarum]|uniref:LD-carboxypeptidase n=1 Tax=Halobacillus shinanisalinarum TaxID=2932258 RepID=A0ABY4GWM6_9BACI|nr:LD-carboxypeptidase [Halobacillus shinanisalinarum]UOQ92577.1 LD-carboxypeptidase [Halobacillus shinanisalinarum]
MLLPKKLKHGDTIGVIAPASPPNLKNLRRSIHFLNQLGLHVKIAPHVNCKYGYLAGTDEQRLEDLHTMFADQFTNGIICAGGGYGTSRIASMIDYKLIKRNPKIFWGYSDITFLHQAIRQKTGLVTFHGPMLSSDVGKENFDPFSQAMFNQLFEPMFLTYSKDISPLRTISPGEACGEIVGGNLSLLVNSIGSAYEIDTRNKLLLIEDVGEEPYRIDSFLSQLKLAGKLEDAAGIIVGDFSEAEPRKPDESLTLEQVFNFYFSRLDKPVLSGFKIGHCLPHFAVPLGAKATLSSLTKTLHIEPGVT